MMCTHGIHHPSLEPTQLCARTLPSDVTLSADDAKIKAMKTRLFDRELSSFNFLSLVVWVQRGWRAKRSHLSNWRCIRHRWGANKVAGIHQTHRELYMTDWVTKLCSLTLMFMLMEISSSCAVVFQARRYKFCVCFGLMVSLIGRIWWRLEVLIIRKV